MKEDNPCISESGRLVNSQTLIAAWPPPANKQGESVKGASWKNNHRDRNKSEHRAFLGLLAVIRYAVMRVAEKVVWHNNNLLSP